MPQNILKNDRRFACLKLLPPERSLIAALGKGTERDNDELCLSNRDEVLRLLAVIARLSRDRDYEAPADDETAQARIALARQIGPIKLEKAETRRSLRISMPDSLDAELDILAKQTGQTKIAILVELAKKFREFYKEQEEQDG
jgi:hypothetical protein